VRVRVAPGRCCGAGQCALIAPAVFSQHDEDGTVLLLNPAPPPALAPAVRSAANRCPSGAIHVDETLP
jgi:ferredoxin